MSTPVIFYTYPLAFYPARVQVMLAEKGVAYTTKFVDLFTKQALEPSFIKLSPDATVPVVQLGDKVLDSSLDICKTLDTLDASEPLGGTKVDRSVVDQLVSSIQAWNGNDYAMARLPEGAKGIMASMNEYKRKVAEARMRDCEPSLKPLYEKKLASMAAVAKEMSSPDPSKIKANQDQLTSILDDAEERLTGGGPFLAGSEYTLADVLISPILFRVDMVGRHKQEIEPRAALKAYHARLQQRPSWNIAFGTASSTYGKLSWMAPAIIKAKVCNMLGCY